METILVVLLAMALTLLAGCVFLIYAILRERRRDAAASVAAAADAFGGVSPSAVGGPGAVPR